MSGFFDRVWSVVSNNLGTKIISVIIAIVLWMVVLGSRNVEVTKEIPLEVITPSELVPANELPEKIAFRLSGPKAFLRTILDRHEEPIRVALAGAKPGLVTYRFFSDSIRVPIGVKVVSISPASILIKLEYLKRRDVPVHLELRGSPPDGYRLVKAEVHPAVVEIKGAESKVDSITEISTLPIDLGQIRQPVERKAPLDIERHGVQLEGELPKVLLDVEPSSANYRIRNVEVRVLSSYAATVSDRSVTVLVRASSKDLKVLDRSQIFAVVDLRGRPKGKYTEPVKITLPDSIRAIGVNPERVTVTLK